MRKIKISTRLSLYFASALLVFSLIIGSIFIFFFREYTLQLNKDDLYERAQVISRTLASYLEDDYSDLSDPRLLSNPTFEYSYYLNFINDIAMADVWIINRNMDLISKGDDPTGNYSYSVLPAYAYSITAKVFNGETTFSTFFSKQLEKPTLTVGTPVFSPNKEIIGAVLLHSPINGMNAIINQAITALSISILIALAISLILSIRYSISFSKPLSVINKTAMMISSGNYCARTNVYQNDEIGDLARTIDIMSEKLEIASIEGYKLDQLKTDFIANISHELRTPITVMRGSLEALKDGVITEPEMISEYYEQMFNETVFLQRLVKDLLDLSKLQNTDFKIEKSEFDMCEILYDAAKKMNNISKAKNVNIKFETNYDYYLFFGDYERIKQMLSVIIDNAVKFAFDNTDITIKMFDRFISISNYGPGIPEKDLPYIFERFHKSRNESNKIGTGLGLAIAKQISQRHGIKISVESEIDKLTTFKITLPLEDIR